MTKLRYARDLPSLTRGARHLLVVAPARRCTAAVFRAVLPAGLAGLAGRLAAGASPGLLGSVRTTLTEDGPERLSLAVLPDRGSHHNSPARAEAIRHVTASAGLPGKGGAVLAILDREDHLVPAANAVVRARPVLDLRSESPAAPALGFLAVNRKGEPIAADKRTREITGASSVAARLVDSPPTELHPGALAREARRLLRGLPGLHTREIVGDKLLEARLGGIHAVGRCAVDAPRMLVARYTPRASRAPHVALVGKGITYDTGGLHLKGRGGMETMKCDMGGAAAVLGAFRVLVATRHPGPVSLVLCLAENAIGPRAYKPDDVLTLHSGLTVEINNTDAEGRLLLADGVSYAARKLGAGIVLDAATLTGAQAVATGKVHAAVVSNDPRLEKTLVTAGRSSGDLVHPLPFAPELYKQEFRSPIADMRNSVKNRANAQSSCAAQFVHWHLEDTDTRWGHVDLAGPAFRADRATGFGVALLAETVGSLAG